MRKLAPVVLFVYNRLTHTQELLKSLEENCLAERTELYIFADQPKRGTVTSKARVVQEFIKQYATRNKFKEVTVVIAKEHQGLANSVISGVSSVIKKHKKAIVLEDDLIVSKDFLNYMNEGLEYYRHNKRIWSIAGFTEPYKSLEDYFKDVYFSRRAESWGWATWYNRWFSVDWEIKNYKCFQYNYIERYLFNRGGCFLAELLDKQKRGLTDSWAIRWCYAQFRHAAYTVHPSITKVNNNGFDGSGVHCGKGKILQNVVMEKRYKFIDISLSKQLLDEIQKYYH